MLQSTPGAAVHTLTPAPCRHCVPVEFRVASWAGPLASGRQNVDSTQDNAEKNIASSARGSLRCHAAISRVCHYAIPAQARAGHGRMGPGRGPDPDPHGVGMHASYNPARSSCESDILALYVVSPCRILRERTKPPASLGKSRGTWGTLSGWWTWTTTMQVGGARFPAAALARGQGIGWA